MLDPGQPPSQTPGVETRNVGITSENAAVGQRGMSENTAAVRRGMPGASATGRYTYTWLTWFYNLYNWIRNIRDNALNLVPAGYGAAEQVVTISPYEPGAGYITIPMDTPIIPQTRGMTLFLATNEFSFQAAGNWRLSVQLTISGHNSIGSARSTNIRFFNVTLGTPGDGYEVTIGRNTGDTTITVPTLVNIPENVLDDVFRMEIGGGDNITGGDLTYVNFSINYIDRLADLVIITPEIPPSVGDDAQIWLNPDTIVGNQPGVYWANDSRASGGTTYDMEVGSPVLPVTTETRNGRSVVVSLGQAGAGGYLNVIASPIPNIVAPYTIFVVCGFDSQQNATGLFDTSVSLSDRVAIRDGNNGSTELYSITTGVIASIPNDTIGHIFAFRMQSGNHRGLISDGAGSPWQTDFTVGDNDFDYASLLTEQNSGLNAGGWVGEVIIVPTAMSDTDMNTRVALLASEWAITL